MRLVSRLAARWDVDLTEKGKTVWAEVTGGASGLAPKVGHRPTAEDDVPAGDATSRRFHVVLGDVPTELLLAAKSHVDNVVREFTLAASGARSGMSAEVTPHLRTLIDTVAYRFAEARDSIKRQALTAASKGAAHTRLELDLPIDAADAGEAYLSALDEVDAYCRAARLLTLETPPQHRVFRRWYVEELIVQLRALARGEQPPRAQTFEERLIEEIERVAAAWRTSERAARLYAIAGALARAATPEAVAEAVLDVGVAALEASGGGLLLSADGGDLVVRGTLGYPADVVARLESETMDAELPAAMALRTGESVWIESRAERDSRFPELKSLEPATISLCAVPLEAQGRRLGALRFSFNKPRLFDADERRFVLTLAAQTAQALQRAQLQQDQIDASMRLQRSLLPQSIPAIDGMEVAAAYHPFGAGMEVGGDFYDVWAGDDDHYRLAIGDVAGTGPEAAALTALVRYSLRALTLHNAEPLRTLRALNAVLLSATPDTGGEVFCTAVFGTIEQRSPTMRIRLASGGHPYPFVRRRDGEVDEVELGGSLLGAMADVEPCDAVVELGPGDTLVLFTDGVIEARDRDGVMFGTEGMARVLAGTGGGAESTVAALESAVLAHVGGQLADDLALLVLRVKD
jgi:serine phosphatase RsbU (regulator of sigma subunit)